MTRPKREPRRMAGAIGQVLAELGHLRDTPALRIAQAWEEVVGPEVAACAEPCGLRRGVLEVQVDSPARAQHLQLRADALLAALAEAVGEGAPRALRFRIGPPASGG